MIGIASVRWIAMCLAVLSVPNASAQRSIDGGLTGTIRDASGAVLVAATITVSSPDAIGGPRSTVSDESGVYRFAALPAGIYEVAVAHSGFTAVRRHAVELLPGLTIAIDFVVTPAGAREEVAVFAPSPVIDVRTSASTVLIDRTLLESLPLSRTAFEAVNLAPGVVRDVAFGGTATANAFSLDGTKGNEPGWGTPTIRPSLHWIDELQIVATGADARHGEFSGVKTNAITRSGSNLVTGAAGYWSTRPGWVGNNLGSLPPALQARFRPTEIFSRWSVDARAGGPVMKDRLWFFTGGEYFRDLKRPVSFANVTYADSEPRHSAIERKLIGKLTAAMSSIRSSGYLVLGNDDVDGANASPLVRPDAQSISSREEAVWNARLQWTLSSRAFLEVEHGGHRAATYVGPPEHRRSGPPGHWDTVTDVRSVNAFGVNEFVSKPVAAGTHFTYAGSLAGQAHDISTGIELERARVHQSDEYVGGMVFLDAAGGPNQVLIWDGQTYRPRHTRTTIYGHDAWRVAERVTLNLGVRTGWYRGSVPAHEHAFSAHSVSPRVGAAWEATADHRTVLRVHYGRYHDEMVTSFYDFLDPLSHNPEITAAVIGPAQFVELSRTPSAAAAAIDAALRYPFVEESFAGLERQLPFGIGVKAHYIRRDFNDTIGFVDAGSQWQPFQVGDPGPDGRLGTADDGAPTTVFERVSGSSAAPLLTNPNAYRRYRAVQVIAAKRSSHLLSFQASYSWSRTTGNYNNAPLSNAANADLGLNGVLANPNAAIYADGRTPQDFTHEFKVLGTHRVPAWGGLTVAAVYRYQSGRPWARTIATPRVRTQVNAVNIEPRGARQLDPVHQLDLRVEKSWRRVAASAGISLFAEVFNAGNQGVALAVVPLSGVNFGVPRIWSEPRIIRGGARVAF